MIDETGKVVLPLLGTTEVTDVRSRELKRRLTEAYRQQLAYQDVQITLLRRVRVLGAVTNPGLYHVDGTMSLGDAIALAGGVTSRGKLRGIRIFRDGNEVIADLDVSARIAERIRSGDQINVPERSWISLNSGIIIGSLITGVALIVAYTVIR